MFNNFNEMKFSYLPLLLGNTTVDELMMRLMAAMEIFSAQQQEDIKDEVSPESCCRYLLASTDLWGCKLTRCFFSQWSWVWCVLVSFPLSEIRRVKSPLCIWVSQNNFSFLVL